MALFSWINRKMRFLWSNWVSIKLPFCKWNWLLSYTFAEKKLWKYWYSKRWFWSKCTWSNSHRKKSLNFNIYWWLNRTDIYCLNISWKLFKWRYIEILRCPLKPTRRGKSGKIVLCWCRNLWWLNRGLFLIFWSIRWTNCHFLIS